MTSPSLGNITSSEESARESDDARKSVKRNSAARRSSQRARPRKAQHSSDLERTVENLSKDLKNMVPQLQQLRTKYKQLLVKNKELKDRYNQLSAQGSPHPPPPAASSAQGSAPAKDITPLADGLPSPVDDIFGLPALSPQQPQHLGMIGHGLVSSASAPVTCNGLPSLEELLDDFNSEADKAAGGARLPPPSGYPGAVHMGSRQAYHPQRPYHSRPAFYYPVSHPMMHAQYTPVSQYPNARRRATHPEMMHGAYMPHPHMHPHGMPHEPLHMSHGHPGSMPRREGSSGGHEMGMPLAPSASMHSQEGGQLHMVSSLRSMSGGGGMADGSMQHTPSPQHQQHHHHHHHQQQHQHQQGGYSQQGVAPAQQAARASSPHRLSSVTDHSYMTFILATEGPDMDHHMATSHTRPGEHGHMDDMHPSAMQPGSMMVGEEDEEDVPMEFLSQVVLAPAQQHVKGGMPQSQQCSMMDGWPGSYAPVHEHMYSHAGLDPYDDVCFAADALL
eukprot:CAMPEP_0202907028 /NCGR_PEP_ID=MMETSP1392-20130828/41020_1 /ASSEMBLY_ACC=CAM_ASM_000868 /TAXON_ID=225041 /ORGANISM="Chlamydomonas chlamydogama, Strain SAG 11-48b" /LENGTH=502 /DNA_ID=CAMNT_0049595759 /DNA_START=296 /DNA_END=1804 /DNA_ORIENTATION=+